MKGLLDGVRVVDLSRILAGPYAAQALGEMGADVVKVEPPTGDPARKMGPFVDGHSLYFASLNTGKRSVVVDLTTDEGRGALHGILSGADIVIENFRPSTGLRLGLSPKRLREKYPGLVIASVPGYRRGSVRADDPSYDLVVQAESGIMSVTGEPNRPPVRAGVPIGDLSAGLWAAMGALAGYVARLRTGQGSHVEVPLLDAALSLLTYVATSAAGNSEEPGPVGSGHHTMVPYRAFPTRDGWLVIAVIGEKFWHGLLSALDLGDQPDLDDNAARDERRDEVDAMVGAALAKLDRADAMARLRAAGVPHGPILSIRETLDSPYAAETARVATIEADGYGYTYVRGPLSGIESPRPAPQLGEHTAEVLAEIASRSQDD